jgi:multiple sugar transport system permease protein
MKASEIVWTAVIATSLAVGSIFPLAYTFYLSLLTGGQPGQGAIGFINYARMFSDPKIHWSIAISVTYTVLSLITSFLLGLVSAFIITSVSKGRRLLEAVYTIPLSVSPIIAGIVWSPSAVWDDVNSLIHLSLGLPFIDVTDPLIYIPIMALAEGWLWSPLFMLGSLVVIDELPYECHEAAAVMGARRKDVMRFLYIPTVLRSKTMKMLLVVKAIDFFRTFEIPFAWSSWVRATELGAPTDNLSLLLFKLLITPSELPVSYVAAISIVLMVLAFAVALTVYRILFRGDGA